MTYGTIYSIFDLMQDTIARQEDIYDDYYEYKKAGNMLEAKRIFSLIKTMDTAIDGYHKLIVNYVNSADSVVDDFDDEFEEFLEDNIYDLDDCYEYGYSDEAIEEIKKEARSKFIIDMWSSVIDDNFCSNDEAIQTFINGFAKIDLYLYIISKS